jgi:hypothetical protein
MDWFATKFIDKLVHLDETLRSCSDFLNDFWFHPDIMSFVCSKQRTVMADAFPVLYTDNLKLSIVFIAQTLVFFRQINLHYWSLFLEQLY